MYLLLDECCGRSLVRLAESLGHVAQRTIEVAGLGRQATDAAIFDFARRSGAVLVTVNRADFVSLAARGHGYPGVIVLPSATRNELRDLFPRVLAAAERLLACDGGVFVEIAFDGRVSSYRVP